jgi:hypothetical protein
MKKLTVLILVLLAILSAAAAYLYFTKTAGALPHFLPGYSQGSLVKHKKHGIAFAGLAVVLLLGAWMVGGKSTDNKVTRSDEPSD